MQKIWEVASEFLAGGRVAVTGVSRDSKNHGSNVVYKRLRERGVSQAVLRLSSLRRYRSWCNSL